jgi:hypothetical protein
VGAFSSDVANSVSVCTADSFGIGASCTEGAVSMGASSNVAPAGTASVASALGSSICSATVSASGSILPAASNWFSVSLISSSSVASAAISIASSSE